MRERLHLLGWMLSLLLGFAAAETRSQSASEEELKAAYLLNFSMFVEWPRNDQPTFTICQYGSDTLGVGAAALSRRTLRGKPITLRKVNARELAGCGILYVTASDKGRLRDLVQAARGTGVLTVSDAEGAAREGATIGLSVSGQKIVFDVNMTEARRSNLVISAKLLSLARTVVETP